MYIASRERVSTSFKRNITTDRPLPLMCSPCSRGASRGLIPARSVSATRRYPCINTPKRERKFNAKKVPLLGGSFGLLWRVLVNAPAAFFPQPAGFYILHQQRSRTIFFAQSFVKVFKDMQTGIQADEVN